MTLPIKVRAYIAFNCRPTIAAAIHSNIHIVAKVRCALHRNYIDHAQSARRHHDNHAIVCFGFGGVSESRRTSAAASNEVHFAGMMGSGLARSTCMLFSILSVRLNPLLMSISIQICILFSMLTVSFNTTSLSTSTWTCILFFYLECSP